MALVQITTKGFTFCMLQESGPIFNYSSFNLLTALPCFRRRQSVLFKKFHNFRISAGLFSSQGCSSISHIDLAPKFRFSDQRPCQKGTEGGGENDVLGWR
jgi:hypothetical protein